MSADLGLLDPELAWGHHLLVVAAEVEADDVEALAMSRFPGASRRDGHTIDLVPGAWLTGPWRLDDVARKRLGLPARADRAYLARSPVQRSAPVPEELQEVGGLLAAFAEGQPEGTEAQVIDFLFAAARRLGSALRVGGSGALLVPDPAEIPDLLVYAPVWLEPEALLVVLRPELPDLRLLLDAGISPAPRIPAGPDPQEDAERARLHAEADAFDAAAMAQDPVLEAYGALSRFPDDGVISVSVEAEPQIPLVLTGFDWAEAGVMTYALRWYPADEDPADTDSADPDSSGADPADGDPAPENAAPAGLGAPTSPHSAAYFTQRGQARDLIEGGALALLEAVGGQVADDDGFLVEL